MTDDFAAGMRRAAEIATLHDGADVTDCKDAGEGYDKAAFDICTAILAAIPASVPWTPPDDRPDGYRCWAWWAFDGNDGRWYRAEWHGGTDNPHWWVFGVGFCKHEMVKHFLPEPPAPEAKP